ncbi:P-loop containing nucleoside triphosphate hydrolase protein [Kockovaella imperatae]|uniref:ATP-dependent RNA helicase n=1 Tax=Kockovaella imperatae TaxID=4999 RepID=A0A1Y1UBB9_9TREE|nr:P-loop containing nucleoside triphosphate hydrolase protein [Kockovaella imperatae]ORX35309.1 P-loop containing nucleoside triphosphate hydrolase protein [Kockovaella imperatae]
MSIEQLNKQARGSQHAVKKAKSKMVRERLDAEDLQWKPVQMPSFAGMDGGGGMMMLEELDGVDVTWEEDLAGRKIARFVSAGEPSRKGKEKEHEASQGSEQAVAAPVESDQSKKSKKRARKSTKEDEADGALPSFAALDTTELDDMDEAFEEHTPSFDDALMPAWRDIDLNAALKRGLLGLGFNNPTEIQKRSLPLALSGRDIVGVAETGSGKTLAYSLPILSHLLNTPKSSETPRPLTALILCPTRELALQVVQHLFEITKLAAPTTSGPPRISVGSVVGGLSAQKQKRIVERGCDILVATPGRLWDLIQADNSLGAGVVGLKYLVIDEADRMIENGHFAELENIVRLIERGSKYVGEDDADPVFQNLAHQDPPRDDLQTFIFSATLSKDLQHNLKKRHRAVPKKSGKRPSALEDLVERLDFRDPEPFVVDLSPEGGVVASLRESMIECLTSEKDLYLYYFLLRYPGRTLVFVGSIDGIRRLTPLFEMLQMPVYPLHSQLQQKQRLKNLDRFKSSSNGTLIATDVAARGLDIPHVDHVVHFNLPRTADAYIHRSGRTARAQNPGFALQLCAPEEKGMQRALMRSLDREHEVPEMPIESGFLPKLKERVTLARDIEKAQHEVKKETHDRNWLQEAADDLGVDIDPELLSEQDDPDLPFHRMKKSKATHKGSKRDVGSLKAELKHLLSQPLIARGVSARYPTSGSKVIVDDLIKSTGHTMMLGAKTTKAHDEDLVTRKKSSLNKRKR